MSFSIFLDHQNSQIIKIHKSSVAEFNMETFEKIKVICGVPSQHFLPWLGEAHGFCKLRGCASLFVYL